MPDPLAAADNGEPIAPGDEDIVVVVAAAVVDVEAVDVAIVTAVVAFMIEVDNEVAEAAVGAAAPTLP